MGAGGAVVRALDEGPGEAAVGGAEDAVAVEGVGGVVGVAGAGEDDAGVDADGSDAERGDGCVAGVGAEDGEGVGEWGEGDGCGWTGGVGGLPDAAAGGSEVDGVAGGVGWIGGEGGDAAGDVAVGCGGDLVGTERLPGCAEAGVAGLGGLLEECAGLLLAGGVYGLRCGGVVAKGASGEKTARRGGCELRVRRMVGFPSVMAGVARGMDWACEEETATKSRRMRS